MANKMNATFEINGKKYATDLETLKLMRVVVDSADKSGDNSAVIAVMIMGELNGRIKEIK